MVQFGFQNGLSLGLTLLSLTQTSAADLVGTGASVLLNDVYYYISPYASGTVKTTSAALASVPRVLGFRPVTVVKDAVATSDLSALFANWTASDDVFQSGFTEGVFLAGADSSTPCKPSVITLDSGVKSFVLPLTESVPSGPYFLDESTMSLHPAYRLYDDFSGSFLEPLLQKPDGSFQSLSAQIPSSGTMTIGVPSRLYFTKTAEKPLAGVRVGVKDLYHLAGTKGSNGSRAWYGLYPTNNVTAEAIQRLIDAGAQIVGLQKLSQFANGETATADWVDYHEPFNPRGDGYQDTSSSSAGGGASMGSYPWLDVAVGSDTGGSIRGPAGAQGIFGNRPSHGLVSLDNAMPLSPTLDTAGFLIRDPYIWDAVCAVVYSKNYTSLVSKEVKYPKTLYTLGWPTDTKTASSALLEQFLNKLSAFLGAKPTVLNITGEWEEKKPAEANGVTLTQLLNTTYATLISKEQISLVREPFYKDYAAVHDGRRPFVNPGPLIRWGYGDSLPDSARDDAVANKTVFMNWFNSEIMPPSEDPLECSKTLAVYVQSSGTGNSERNKYGKPPGVPFGFSTGRISVFAEIPDIVFPVGQVPADSTVTLHQEYYPVGVSFLVAKGCDGLVIRLAQDLVEAGIISIPLTGQTITGGEILMK